MAIGTMKWDMNSDIGLSYHSIRAVAMARAHPSLYTD
jgi:hypothetical protein